MRACFLYLLLCVQVFVVTVADIDALPVDESLFENVDDLDLGDDDSDDEDYVPGASDSDEDDN